MRIARHYVVWRLIVSIGVVALSSFLVFLLVATSGDPLAELRRSHVPHEVIHQRERELHLDRPVVARYAIWVGGLLRGDLGTSVRGEEVGPRLLRSVGVTLRMVILAMLLALVVALTVGARAAMRRYSPFDHFSTLLAFVALSMPVFWLAGVLKDLAVRFNDAVGARVFLVAQERTPGLDGGFFTIVGDRLSHLVLPVLTLSLLSMAEWSRFLRASVLDELGADYVKTARAKGLSERAVVARHAVRNACIPLTAMVSLNFGRLLGGAVVTEAVFGWNGMGRLLVDGVEAHDTQLVSAWLLVGATAVVLMNFAGDVAQWWLDPRVRRV
jgi:peptide/nickel transport system permease protein